MSEKLVPTNKVVSLESIKPHPQNYNTHPDEQIKQLGASYTELGQFRSVVLWEQTNGTYIQLAGHGVVEAMKHEGATEVRADVLPPSLDPMIAKRIMLADNLHAQNSSPDDELLATLLQEQSDAGYDLASLGTDDETLRQMLEALTPASGDEWSEALGDLPDGDKAPFQQMTFTLSNEQADMVKEALDLALEDKDNFEDMGNQNSNGNALAYVVKFYLEMGKVTA